MAPEIGTDLDAEGLAIAADGTIFISDEKTQAAWQLGESALPQRLPRHPDFDAFGHKKGVESLVINADGTLYSLLEQLGFLQNKRSLFRYQSVHWDKAL